jgi:F-type H+-transporting ATPase subunit delta
VINARIARRYAKALLAIGKEDGQAETYQKELADFAKLLKDNQELEHVIVCPLYADEARKNVLKAFIEKMGPSKIMASFLSLLFEKGRIQYLTDISLVYERLTDELADIMRADVVSAVELPDEGVEKIKKALSEQTGKQVTIETKVDASLIGGVVTKIGDLVLDGSVKTQLNSLKESLQRGEGI